MCKYTYHHDPNCGHISSFNIDICTAFTSSLRQTESDKRFTACTKTVYNHDLNHPSKPVLCLQCEEEWMEKAKARGRAAKGNAYMDADEEESDYDDAREFLPLEGLASPMEVWMTVTRPKEHCRGEERATRKGKSKKKPSLFGLGITTDGEAVPDDANIYTTIYDEDNYNYYDNDSKSPIQSDHTLESSNPFDPEFLFEIGLSNADVDTDATPTLGNTKEYYDLDDSIEIDVEPEMSDNQGNFMNLEDSSDEERTPPVSPRTQELRELEEITSSAIPSIKQILSKLYNAPPDFFPKTTRIKRIDAVLRRY